MLRTTGLVTSRSRTWDNIKNLARGFFEAMQDTYGGSRRGREELNGEVLEDHANALWTRAILDKANAPTRFTPEDFTDVVVAIDPPISTGKNANACGIIVAARVKPDPHKDAHAIILHDGTIQGLSPSEWAARAMWLAAFYKASHVVVEANQGGDLVRTVLRARGENIRIKNVWAHVSKRVRAESIAHHYETGKIHHEDIFPELEEELCTLGATDSAHNPISKKSPDRADALIWAILDLLPQTSRWKPKFRLTL